MELFPRLLSPGDRILVGFELTSFEVDYEYDVSSGRFLVSKQDRLKLLPHLIQAGLPTEPKYDSQPPGPDEHDFLAVLALMFNSTDIEWSSNPEKRSLSVRSSWVGGPGDAKSVCRSLALYYPDLHIDQVEMKFELGTDLPEGALERYGRASFEEEQGRQRAVQLALDEALPGRARCVLSFTSGPLLEVDDGIDDLARFLQVERARVTIFADDLSDLDLSKEELTTLEAESCSIEFRDTSWTDWQRDLAVQALYAGKRHFMR